MKTFQDFRNEISIIELALANGYKLDKKAGLKYPVLKDEVTGDKIIILNPNSSSNQGYFNPHDDKKDKGTLISFVENRLGSVFPVTDSSKSLQYNINAILYDFLRLPLPERNVILSDVKNIAAMYTTREFKLPNELEQLNDSGYLHFRGISSETLQSSIFADKILNLSQNGFRNVAFPYYDANGEVVGLEVRNKQFKQFLKGSDRSNGIWYSNINEGEIANVILSESPIDSLSYHQLKGSNKNMYVAFGGSVSSTQLSTLQTILNKMKIKHDIRIISAVDRDEAGERYTEKFKAAFPGKVLVDYPILNDYNLDLTTSFKKKQISIKR